LDHVRRFLDGGNLFGTFFIERDFELFFERHHYFDGVERVGAEVDELGVRGDGVEIRAELLGDDGANLVEGVLGLRERKSKSDVTRAMISRLVSALTKADDRSIDIIFETMRLFEASESNSVPVVIVGSTV